MVTTSDVGRWGLWILGASFLACAAATPVAPQPIRAPAALTTEVPQAIASPIPFVSLEGPFWVAEGGCGYLLFSDVVEQNGADANIYRFDPGPAVFAAIAYPDRPISSNGLAVDSDGSLIVCERWNGRLARVAGTKAAVLAGHSPSGAPLNAPNDVTLRADGNIYFSDTTWGARPGTHAPTAVYRLSPDGLLSVVFQVEMPNGVALSPDGKTLYVGSDVQNRLWQLSVAADGSVGKAMDFVAPNQGPDATLRVPDGLCVDDRGRLYVANNSPEVSAIVVFESDGTFAGRIPFPVAPSNCSFGGADRRTLYVTTLHAIYRVPMTTPGLP